jgi:hypothetical protein
VAVPGWYPDPGHRPGHFRYWDGTAWSHTTTANPAVPPPGPPRPPGRRLAPLLAAAAVLVVLAIVAVVVVRYVGDRGVSAADPTTSAPRTGSDDRTIGPLPRPTSPGTRVSEEPAPSAGQPCPLGDPSARQDHPRDGRVHGGGLSFPSQPGWDSSTLDHSLSWAYDVGGEQRVVQPDWYAQLSVGALFTLDGFETPEQAAEAVMRCTANSSFYDGFTQRSDLIARAVTISGHAGWQLRSEIHVESDLTTGTGDVVDVVVVDLDSPESLAMFWGAVQIGEQPLISQLDRVDALLRAD